MAKVHINFLGPLRLFLGTQSVVIEANSVAEVKQFIESQYGPPFQKKLQSMGVKKGPSIWENSLFLLNGRSLRKEEEVVLQEGDRLDLGISVAGG